ncbi:PREDICTED: fibroblast growth factor-binding protein 1-like [Poecilia mexicana]|uniref:fibroblast growth factor-binding protein 1-like n=1 Tax=Poecilia mexicana TaxID=48701 RepID=UPI00072DF489|nr:PREDICTED: fibroblast growth factor-binding protein 1-like [Poecilia mexicana]
MALLTNIAILMVLACISHQMMLGSCQRSHGRRGREDRGHRKERSGLSRVKPVGDKLVTKDGSRCTWTVTDNDPLFLFVTCKKGEKSFNCRYVGRPALCPQYRSNTLLYWKQITRALKKQSSLCHNEKLLVRAGMCKHAPREAHFRLVVSQKTVTPSPYIPAAPVTAAKSCLPKNKKLAKEFCSDSWSSVCTFFSTMVNNYDC